MNYNDEMQKIITSLDTNKHYCLLLHSCCGPCSTVALERLADVFDITVFYYNPNIYPYEEYTKRKEEQQRLIADLQLEHPINFVEGTYDPLVFDEVVHGLENEKEGYTRCHKCYLMRLEATAQYALAHHFDYFTTTLTVSPHKDSQILNQIGMEVATKYHLNYLPSDFKKNNGYLRSIELSKEYQLYRQNYCGCKYSLIKN